MDNDIRIGTVEGTGAALTVELGFVPDYVKVANIEDADRIDEWYAGMADGTSLAITTAVALLATNGITPYAGDATHRAGFIIGSTISETGKTLVYKAERTGAGV